MRGRVDEGLHLLGALRELRGLLAQRLLQADRLGLVPENRHTPQAIALLAHDGLGVDHEHAVAARAFIEQHESLAADTLAEHGGAVQRVVLSVGHRGGRGASGPGPGREVSLARAEDLEGARVHAHHVAPGVGDGQAGRDGLEDPIELLIAGLERVVMHPEDSP